MVIFPENSPRTKGIHFDVRPRTILYRGWLALYIDLKKDVKLQVLPTIARDAS